MADSDALNDAGAADGEKDLVADFLMREQDKLAGLEDDFGMKYVVDVFRLRNDLYCVQWGVKLYSLTHCCLLIYLSYDWTNFGLYKILCLTGLQT